MLNFKATVEFAIKAIVTVNVIEQLKKSCKKIDEISLKLNLTLRH